MLDLIQKLRYNAILQGYNIVSMSPASLRGGRHTAFIGINIPMKSAGAKAPRHCCSLSHAVIKQACHRLCSDLIHSVDVPRLFGRRAPYGLHRD